MPYAGSTAGNVLDEITASISDKTIIKYLVVGNAPESIFAKMQPHETFVVRAPVEFMSGHLGIRYAVEAVAEFETKQISKKVQNLVDSIKPDKIILDIQSHPLLSIADKINFRTSEVITFLWDHWSWRYSELSTSKRHQGTLNLARIRILDKSSFIVAPSTEFADFLVTIDKSWIDKLIVFHVPIKDLPLKSRTGPAASMVSHTKVIAFAGQPYAFSELMDLIEAIKVINSGDLFFKVILRVYGQYHLFDRPEFQYEFVENKGFREPDILIEELAMADVLFLPSLFAISKQEISSLSFPSKLSSYLSSCTPLIYYGPLGTPPSKVLYDSHYPYMMISQGVSNLSYILERFFDDYNFQRRATKSIEDLRNGIFSREHFEDGLKLLGLEPNGMQVKFLDYVNFESFYWRRFSLTWFLVRKSQPLIHFQRKYLALKKNSMLKLRALARRFALKMIKQAFLRSKYEYSKGNPHKTSWIVNGTPL